MPLFMDIHRDIDGTPEEVADAHRKDVEVQGKYDANFTKYWFDEDGETVFCLFEAPDAETGEKVHDEAHGLLAEEIHQVREGK